MSDPLLPTTDDRAFPLGDLKSHLASLWCGCCIGAFVCSMIVLATAMAYNGGL